VALCVLYIVLAVAVTIATVLRILSYRKSIVEALVRLSVEGLAAKALSPPQVGRR